MLPLTRRQFIGRTSRATLAATTLASPFARALRAGEPGANDKIHMALIGCGGMGQGDLKCFLQNQEVEFLVVCDVDDAQLGKAAAICEQEHRNKPEFEKDFRKVLERKDIDAVLVATPDHWHALPTVMACQAGKDVYVEKPLAKTIDEGRAMLEAVKKHERIVQMGSQWRSCKHIIEAGELVRSGKLGKVNLVRAWTYLDWLEGIGHKADCAVPAGVDYDMWLGPAPKRPFNPSRFHFNFRWFWDYAGGLMTDWGVHLLNMLDMGLQLESVKSVSSCGGKFIFDDDAETPDSQISLYEFPSFQMVWEHRSGLNNGLNGRAWGVEWTGTEGKIILDDNGWQSIPERKHANLDPARNPGSGDPRPAHVRNFLDCVKSRKQPALNLEIGHRLSTLAHLGNIAYRTGNKLAWDAVHERIVDDHEADKLVGIKYRKPWHLPYSARS